MKTRELCLELRLRALSAVLILCLGKNYDTGIEILIKFCSSCVAVLRITSSQQSSSSPAAYYGYTGYTRFSSASDILHAEIRTDLSTRFRFCRVGGVLLEALGPSGVYFTVGINSEQQLVMQYRNSDGETTQVSFHLVN